MDLTELISLIPNLLAIALLPEIIFPFAPITTLCPSSCPVYCPFAFCLSPRAEIKEAGEAEKEGTTAFFILLVIELEIEPEIFLASEL